MSDYQNQFMDTLTMAEIAKLEADLGISLENMENTKVTEMLPALGLLALNRLQISASIETVKQLTVDELNEIFDKASSLVPTRPSEIYAILNQVRGKSPSDYSNSSEQSQAI